VIELLLTDMPKFDLDGNQLQQTMQQPVSKLTLELKIVQIQQILAEEGHD